MIELGTFNPSEMRPIVTKVFDMKLDDVTRRVEEKLKEWVHEKRPWCAVSLARRRVSSIEVTVSEDEITRGLAFKIDAALSLRSALQDGAGKVAEASFKCRNYYGMRLDRLELESIAPEAIERHLTALCDSLDLSCLETQAFDAIQAELRVNSSPRRARQFDPPEISPHDVREAEKKAPIEAHEPGFGAW